MINSRKKVRLINRKTKILKLKKRNTERKIDGGREKGKERSYM